MDHCEDGDHASCRDGERRRLFEMLYCEACGNLFLGGRRAALGDATELSASSPDLESIPETAASSNFESLTHEQYAVFWPRTSRVPDDLPGGERWDAATIDTRNSVLFADHSTGPIRIPGLLYSLDGRRAATHHRAAGSADFASCRSRQASGSCVARLRASSRSAGARSSAASASISRRSCWTGWAAVPAKHSNLPG